MLSPSVPAALIGMIVSGSAVIIIASAANKAVMRLNFIFIILYLLIIIFKVHISPLLFIIFYTAFSKMTLPRWVNYVIRLEPSLLFYYCEAHLR